MKETKKYDSINIKRNSLTKVPFYVISDSVGVTMGIDYQALIKETVRLWYDYTGLRANSTLNTCIISDLYIS